MRGVQPGSDGLSPATRGTHPKSVPITYLVRFIPGYAGNALCKSLSTAPRSVYPRLRGERLFQKVPNRKPTGLSPATRGTPESARMIAEAIRFIPGYAGNASRREIGTSVRPVYPRLRGERYFNVKRYGDGDGLSPATRGTPIPHNNIKANYRFIPGYAGNATRQIPPAVRQTVYPRLRGERSSALNDVCSPAGLSPATRGTRFHLTQCGLSRRFIPGYAGNAIQDIASSREVSVYPRLRGERASTRVALVKVSGLSPATRGTR